MKIVLALALVLVFLIALVFVAYRKEIINQLFGEKIAVLGASTAGKTTLFRYLEMLPMESTEIIATRVVSKTGIGGIQIGFWNKIESLRFKPTKDTPGDEENRNIYWEKLVKESDTVLYIVNAYKLLRGEDQEETQRRVEADLKLIRNVPNFDPTKVIIIGNHFDEIDEGFAFSDKIDRYTKEFKN